MQRSVIRLHAASLSLLVLSALAAGCSAGESDPDDLATSTSDLGRKARCGDGKCQAGETCSTCASDCGSCPSADTIAPSVPLGISASASSCSRIDVAWGASTDTGGSQLQGYRIYKNGAFAQQVQAATTSFSDSALSASTSYAYSVSAIDNAGNESARSAAASAVTPACPTQVPVAGFVRRSNPRRYHVTPAVTVRNASGTLTQLSVVFGAPQTNAYQDVDDMSANTAGRIEPVSRSDGSYLRFLETTSLPAPGTSKVYSFSYDVTLYDISVDLGSVTAIAPYDKSSTAFTWYTGTSGAYVDPNNATIASIGASLWAASPNVVAYARAAYEYVASHYAYLDPNSGLHPLADVLAAGGGDCGNLSSIYVSLLRNRGIPARHLVTSRPDGSFHVWADFYLQGYGWVPVDVTAKQSNPGGDYFGKVGPSSNGGGIIESEGVNLSLDNGGGTTTLSLLQTFGWWYWSSTQVSASATWSQVATPL
jgi:transglutaminase-like putative cysteine protease